MAAKVEKRVNAEGVSWWLVVHSRGKRKRKSYGKNRQEAERAAREVNRRLRDGGFNLLKQPSGPTLTAFTKDYLANRISHLSTRQQLDRRGKLKKDGLILGPLGDRRLGSLTSDVLLEWVETHVQMDSDRNPRSRQTVTHYINAIASVLKYARARRVIQADPTRELRELLAEETRTKRGRSEKASKANPIELQDLARLLDAARGDRREWTWIIVVCLLDSGIRLGELRALVWGQVAWGSGDGTGRHLMIDQNIPSGLTEPEETKSGYRRKVQLSRRLRTALLERWMAQGQPGPDHRIFPGLNGDNFRSREWARICGKSGAGIGHHQIKSLRDSYASTMLTAGIPVGFVSKQLGHRSIQVTEQHYARWLDDGDEYRAPEPLAPAEVPADLIARLIDGGKRPKTSHEREEVQPTGTVEG